MQQTQHILTYFKHFLTLSTYGSYISIHISLIVFFLDIDRGGVGCSAQVEMVPIACASLVANATGPKITRTDPFYTFFLYFVNNIGCHIS